MQNLRIQPIKVGTIIGDKSAFTYLQNYGVQQEQPVLIWYIDGADKKVLVDTGPCNPDWAAKYHWPLKRTPEEEPSVALKRRGIDPESIDIVILSHLHWDHAFNNHLFPDAQFIVQEAELRYAICPLPVHAKGYEAVTIGMRPDYYTHTKFTVIRGDREIIPGISVILTSGHSPGSQCVVVETYKGNYVIASDTVPMFENWEGTDLMKHIPSGIHVGLTECFESFEKIERVADFVLPGHDIKVLEQEWYP